MMKWVLHETVPLWPNWHAVRVSVHNPGPAGANWVPILFQLAVLGAGRVPGGVGIGKLFPPFLMDISDI